MLTDRGVGPLLAAAALADDWVTGCGLLHLPAYSLASEPIRGAALAAAARVPRLSVNLSSTAVLRDHGVGRFRDLLAELRPETVFGTEAEAELIGDLPGSDLVVKLGPRGVRAAGVVHPARPARAVNWTRRRRRVRGGIPARRGQPGPDRGGPGGGDDGSDAMTITPRLSEEVEAALRQATVVALETTLVSHGFPGALGVQVALAAEARVRQAGAVPATVGIVDCMVRVGLTVAELERFASAGPSARKTGPRDLAACVVQGGLGATTVGGTLAVCRLAGIAFMATGGTGGVHRGFAASLDISADLPQIARTRALVVSSGVKSILDVRPPPSCWRPSACRCSAGGPARCRCSIAPRAALRCPRW